MDKKLIPGTIIFCVEAAILGVVLMGGALDALTTNLALWLNLVI